MRHIPEEMAARIESGAAGLCHVWLLERADGVKMGFTDHDGDLAVEGVTCRASSGWTAGAAESAVGLGAGSASVAGGLDDAAGLYDRARVELWRVDWAKPELRVRLWAGALAAIRREGEGFTADLAGPMAALEKVVGRTYGRACDALLGDGRCRVDVAAWPGRTCDKRWETCVGVFGNGANFQGFPDIPGDDFLTAVPVEAGRNDGGSRR